MIQTSDQVSRLAITGAGVVTPIGLGLDAFVESLRAGRQGFSTLDHVPTPRGKSAVGLIDEPAFDGLDRGYRMAAAALSEALESANLDAATRRDAALIVSTIGGDSRAAEDLYARFIQATAPDDELVHALRLYPNGEIANLLADAFGCFGPRLVITNACASGNIALGLALDMIRLGRCQTAVVVGVDNVKLSMIWGAERAGFVGRALKPFHRHRDGSVLGEGAAALIVERPDKAGDKPLLGWLEGFGCVCDRGAAAITLLEDGSGLRRSMALALQDAGRAPDDLEYVNAHAPGTRMIDLIECQAVADLCGPHAASVDINATKSMTAHMSGASAIAEVIATLLQMRAGFLHPNAGLDEPDPALAIAPIGLYSISRRVSRALSNACGGGGLNTSVMVTAPEESEPRANPTGVRQGARVVITGVGSVSTLGTGSLDLSSETALQSAPAPGYLAWFDIGQWYSVDTQYAYMNRAAQLAAAAAAIAIADASLAVAGGPYEDDRIAVIAGTYLGGGPQASEVMCRGLLDNPNAIRPSMSLDHGVHLGAALVCRHFGFTGSTYTLNGTGTAGLQALIVAHDLLLCDRADAALVLGYDALDQPLQRAMSLLDDCPQKDRLGEGAGALVVERLDMMPARETSRCVAIHNTALLSGPLDSPAAIQRLAGRLAARLDGADWQVIYLAAPLDARMDTLAAQLASTAQKSTPVKRLQHSANHCLAADALLALTTAAVRRERALILAAETDGTVAGAVVGPD